MNAMAARARVLCTAVGLLVVGACDSDPAEQPAPTESHAEGPQRAAAGSAAIDTKSAADAVAAGRREVAAGNPRAAREHFERALELDPGNARIRCEAGYTAFLAGDIDSAETEISEALQQMSEDPAERDARRSKAMCLYNRALVHERRGELEEARQALQESLELRPNRTVREKLAALGGEPTAGATATATGRSGCHVVRQTEECATSAGDPPCTTSAQVVSGGLDLPVPPRSNRAQTEAALGRYADRMNCELGAEYDAGGRVERLEGHCMGEGTVVWEYRGCD